MEQKKGMLHIYRYTSNKGQKYMMCYYDGKFRFVHINENARNRLTPCKNAKGETYLLYCGEFFVEDKCIAIN